MHNLTVSGQIMQLCSELGVHTTSTLLGKDLAVVPLQSWHSDGGPPHNFDSCCSWPSDIGDSANANNSVRENENNARFNNKNLVTERI